MRFALVDSGLGLLSTAAWLRRLRPDIDLVLALDPDAMPWGALPPAAVTERVVRSAKAAVASGADVLVVPCNTASTIALDRLRAELEPEIPVVGTVPAVKPAAALGHPFAIWATPATTAGRYQADLVRRFAGDLQVAMVACPDFAEAIEVADQRRVAEAVDHAAGRTPPTCTAVVLGCTHYPLVRDRIAARLPPRTVLLDSSEAVARQALRRAAVRHGVLDRPGGGQTTVLLSGRPGGLPAAAANYAESAALLG